MEGDVNSKEDYVRVRLGARFVWSSLLARP
jgi:hypothetical protein